jgi:hypothetical protein
MKCHDAIGSCNDGGVCIAQEFLPARHQVLSLVSRFPIRWTARGVGILAGDRIYNVSQGPSPAAAVLSQRPCSDPPVSEVVRSLGDRPASFKEVTGWNARASGTRIDRPGTHLSVTKGRSVPPSRAPEGDVFLSMSKRTSLNIRVKWKVMIYLLDFL